MEEEDDVDSDDDEEEVVIKGAVRVRAGECQCAAILYRLRFGC